jgi:cysteinyl-tRNA synthetase
MAQGLDGPTVRYWLLATHYRTVLKYSRLELQRAAQCVSRGVESMTPPSKDSTTPAPAAKPSKGKGDDARKMVQIWKEVVAAK